MELWVFYDVRDHWDLLGWHLVFGPETDVFRFILRKVFHVDVLFITICTVIFAPGWYGRKWRIGDELRLKPNRCQFELNIRVKLSLQICALFEQLLFLLIWLRLRNLFFESQEFSLNWHPTCKLRMKKRTRVEPRVLRQALLLLLSPFLGSLNFEMTLKPVNFGYGLTLSVHYLLTRLLVNLGLHYERAIFGVVLHANIMRVFISRFLDTHTPKRVVKRNLPSQLLIKMHLVYLLLVHILK